MKRLGLSAESVKTAFANARVNLADYKERLYQPLFDYQVFPNNAPPVPTKKYFQVPIGQQGKTLEDTNMDLAGQLPKGTAFLVTGIAVDVLPLDDITTDSANSFTDTAWRIYRSGHLIFKVGSKEYVRQGNLMKFPAKNRLYSSTSTTAVDVDNSYASATGEYFEIVPILLESNQNFVVEINDIEAGLGLNGARVGVHLDGYLYRNAQ